MMYTGRILNSVIVLIVAVSSSVLAIAILRHWKGNGRKLSFFGFFWLFTSLLWSAVTVRSFAAAFGEYEIDQLFFVIAQINVFISAFFLSGYIFEKLFSRKIITYAGLLIYGFLAVASITFTIINGANPLDLTNFFATEYEPSPEALLIFNIMIIPLVVLLLLDIFLRIVRLFRRTEDSASEFLASIAVLLYMLVGSFDQAGTTTGWYILLLRLLFIGAFLLAYYSISDLLRQRTEKIVSHSPPVSEKSL